MSQIPKTTTVITHHGARSELCLEDWNLPEKLLPTQILCKTSSIALNPVDVKLKGVNPGLRTAVGRDFSGTVMEVGADVAAQQGVKVGDRVCGVLATGSKSIAGTWTLANVRTDVVMKTPDRLSDAEAAGIPVVYGTAFQMLEKVPSSSLTSDSRILVLGGGTTVGHFVVQLLKYYYNVNDIVATASDASAARVQNSGAGRIINYKQADLGKALIESAQDKLYDAVLDTAGGLDAINVWSSIAKPYSVYSTCAGDVGPEAAGYNQAAVGPMLWSIRRLPFRAMFGSWYSKMKYYFVGLDVKLGKWTEASSSLFGKNSRVTVPIDSVYSLDKFQDAWNKQNSTRSQGKVIINMN